MTVLNKEKHIDFITKLMMDKECYEYWMTIPIRTNNFYWGIGAVYLFGGMDKLDKEGAINISYHANPQMEDLVEILDMILISTKHFLQFKR